MWSRARARTRISRDRDFPETHERNRITPSNKRPSSQAAIYANERSRHDGPARSHDSVEHHIADVENLAIIRCTKPALQWANGGTHLCHHPNGFQSRRSHMMKSHPRIDGHTPRRKN